MTVAFETLHRSPLTLLILWWHKPAVSFWLITSRSPKDASTVIRSINSTTQTAAGNCGKNDGLALKRCACFICIRSWEQNMYCLMFLLFSFINLTQLLIFPSVAEKASLWKHNRQYCWAKDQGKSVKSRGCLDVSYPFDPFRNHDESLNSPKKILIIK